MTKYKRIRMDDQEVFGPFNNIICRAEGSGYKVKAKDTSDPKSTVFVFDPNAIKYYGEWKEDNISGDIKNGLKIKKEPIYVFINPKPEDSDQPRAEIDFS